MYVQAKRIHTRVLETRIGSCASLSWRVCQAGNGHRNSSLLNGKSLLL